MATEKMRRLCYVTAARVLQRDGLFLASPTFLQLMRSLVQEFPEATLICPGYHADALAECQRGLFELRLPSVKVRPLPMRAGRFWRSLKHGILLWRTLGDADLVCLDLPNETTFLAMLVCRLRDKPFFVQVCGDWGRAVLLSGPPTQVRKIKAAIADWMASVVVRHSPLVLVQGRDLYDNYVGLNPAAVKSDFVHSTLARDVFHEPDSEPLHEPIRLLSVSGLVRLKGLDSLAKAISLMLSRGLRVEWWCVGDGPYRQSLEDLASTLGVAERVRFWGMVPFGPELFRLYREADIFVHPSLTEGVPNAILEAMAHSLPIVASAVGGIPRVITNGVDGLLVPPGRPEEIADAVRRFAENHELVTRMRRAAFNKAQEYRSDVLAERSKRLIESVFGRIASG